jgi:hypothetical protein
MTTAGLRGSFDRWQLSNQIAIFYFRYIFIQRARRRATNYISNLVKVSIMTGTDVMLLICVPRDAAAQVSANIGKDTHVTSTRSHNK